MSEIKNRSLKKAIDVINCFLDRPLLGVTEISEILGLNKSNVFDILSTFSAMGYVEKDSASNKYSLGIAAVKLGRAASHGNNLKDLVSKHLRQIAADTNEAAFFTVRQGDKIYYMDIAVPLNNIYAGTLGNTLEPMYCTSSGKSILAYMPEAFIEEYLSHPLEKRTDNTITDPTVLREELRIIRERGYACDNMEFSIGISCVAVPILDHDGLPLGAISISGPSPRVSGDIVDTYVCILKDHTAQIKSLI